MSAEIHVFRCLEDNIGALVHDPATGACAAIDAPEEGPILGALAERGWTLSDILVTHRHSDHVRAIPALKQRTGCRVSPRSSRPAEVPAVDAWVREGDTVHVGELQAHVWETPGHCADHVSYWFAADRALFAGDTSSLSAAAGCWTAPSPLFGTRSQRLAALPDEAKVYSGHDYVLVERALRACRRAQNEALKARAAEAEGRRRKAASWCPRHRIEKATNPFLRAGEPASRERSRWKGATGGRRFQALREWKNRF